MNEKVIKLRAFNTQLDKVSYFEVYRANKSPWKRNKRLFKIKPLTLGIITLMAEHLTDILDKTEVKNPEIVAVIKHKRKFLNALSIAITGGKIDEKVIKFITENCTVMEIKEMIVRLMVQANYEDFFFSIRHLAVMNPAANDKIEGSVVGELQK